MQELKNLFVRCFFLACGFECEWTISQNWLADVTGQLKTIEPLLKMQLPWIYWGYTSALKIFHYVLFRFVSVTHLLSTFQTTLQTLELLLFFALSGFLWHLWQVYSCLYLFICAPHQSSHCTVFFFFTLLFFVGKKMSSLWLCHPAPVRKLFFHHSLSLWKGQGELQELLQRLRSLTVVNVVPMITSSSLRSVPLQKCWCQSQVFSVLLLWWFQSKYYRRRRCSTCHSEKGTLRQRRGVVLRLTWVFPVWPLLLFLRKKSLPTTPFLISSFISHSCPISSLRCPWCTYVDVAPPCLWVVIDLLDPSFFSISFWSAGLNFTPPSRPLEASKHCCCCPLSSLCSLSPRSHMSSSTRPSSIHPSLIPLIMLFVPLSVVATAILFPWKSNNTLKRIFPQTSSLLPRGPVLQVATWFLKSLLIPWTITERKCWWLAVNESLVMPTKSTTHSRSTFILSTVSALISSICLYTTSLDWSHLVT